MYASIRALQRISHGSPEKILCALCFEISWYLNCALRPDQKQHSNPEILLSIMLREDRMPEKEFISFPVLIAGNDEEFNHEVYPSGSRNVAYACFTISNDLSGGMVKFTSSDEMIFIQAKNDDKSWVFSVLLGDVVATAKQVQRRKFIFEQDNLTVEMTPGDKPNSFVCSSPVEPPLLDIPSIPVFNVPTFEIMATIEVKSSDDMSIRLSYNTDSRSLIPFFCLWMVEFQRHVRDRALYKGSCLIM